MPAMPVSAARRLTTRPFQRQSTPALPWRSALARLLLGLMLLVAQQGALLHALGHGFEALKQGTPQQSTSHNHDCCAAFHGLDHAVAAAPSLPVAESAAATHVAQTPHEALPGFRPHFQSRAPPRYS